MSLEKPRFKKWRIYTRQTDLKQIPSCIGVFDVSYLLTEGDDVEEFTNAHSALNCSFSPNDSCIVNVFGAFSFHTSPPTSAEVRRVPSGVVGIWDISDDADIEYEDYGYDDLMELVFTMFTYSGVPYPTFSACGNFICSVGNNSQGKLSLIGFTNEEDEDGNDMKTFQATDLSCVGGNLNGRTKLSCIGVGHAVTVTDMKLKSSLNDYNFTVWRVIDDEHNEEKLFLKHQWTKRFYSLFPNIQSISIPPHSLFVNCCFSPGGEHIAILLSNAEFCLINIRKQTCEYGGNLRNLVDLTSGHVSNFCFHPIFRYRFLAFGLLNKCYTIDIVSNSVQKFIEVEESQTVTHVSYSKNGNFFSVCTLPRGNVFVYSTRGRNCSLLHVLRPESRHLDDGEPDINNLKANCANFSSTSEEILVAYSNGDVSVWQLPRTVNLKEICRTRILTLVDGDDVDSLPLLPKKLKDFLNFSPQFD